MRQIGHSQIKVVPGEVRRGIGWWDLQTRRRLAQRTLKGKDLQQFILQTIGQGAACSSTQLSLSSYRM